MPWPPFLCPMSSRRGASASVAYKHKSVKESVKHKGTDYDQPCSDDKRTSGHAKLNRSASCNITAVPSQSHFPSQQQQHHHHHVSTRVLSSHCADRSSNPAGVEDATGSLHGDCSDCQSRGVMDSAHHHVRNCHKPTQFLPYLRPPSLSTYTHGSMSTLLPEPLPIPLPTHPLSSASLVDDRVSRPPIDKNNKVALGFFFSHGYKVTVLDWGLKIFVIDLVSSATCALIRSLTDDHVQRMETLGQHGRSWRTLYTYTKMDIPTCEVPGLSAIMHTIMYNVVHVIGDVCLNPSLHATLCPRSWKEPHLLLYQTGNDIR
jgi:hypothetical protein